MGLIAQSGIIQCHSRSDEILKNRVEISIALIFRKTDVTSKVRMSILGL